MSPRDTRTGSVMEQMVLPALKQGSYIIEKQVYIGTRLGGGKHIVDIVARNKGEALLISLKWQQVSGTAEQKVPFEAICLAEAVHGSDGKFDRAYLVLGGTGWKLREFYIGGGLKEHLTHADIVSIVALEDFIAKANKGQL